MATDVERNGVILTFFCGPLGRQMVQVNVGSAQREMTLVEFNKLIHDALCIIVKRIESRGLVELPREGICFR